MQRPLFADDLSQEHTLLLTIVRVMKLTSILVDHIDFIELVRHGTRQHRVSVGVRDSYTLDLRHRLLAVDVLCVADHSHQGCLMAVAAPCDLDSLAQPSDFPR